METNRSLNPESPGIDPAQIKPGEIWEISRCVKAPINLELQEKLNINLPDPVRYSSVVNSSIKDESAIGIIDTGWGDYDTDGDILVYYKAVSW